MTSRTTTENARATLDALPDGDALLDAIQLLLDKHISMMATHTPVVVPVPMGAVPPVAPGPRIGLKEALLAGEPA